MAKKKKLSKEELKAENNKLRQEVRAKNAGSTEDSERIVNSLKKENIIAYALSLLLPIVGVWWLWHKRETLKLNNASMLLWTGIGIIILVEQVMMIWQYLGY